MTFVPAPKEIFEELSDQLNKFQLLLNLEDKDLVEELNLKEAKMDKMLGRYGYEDGLIFQISLEAKMGEIYKDKKRSFTLDVFVAEGFDPEDDFPMVDSNVSTWKCTDSHGFEWSAIGDESFGIDDIKYVLIKVGFTNLLNDAQLIRTWGKEYVQYCNDKYERDILPYVPGAKSVSYVAEDKVEIILENGLPIYSSTSSVYHSIEQFKKKSKN